MRIGIDCRKINDYGIGTYIRGLLHGLAALQTSEHYIAFVPASARALIPASIEAVTADVPNYSVREFVAMDRAIDRARLDLYHSPHFVLPLTDCPTVVTLHDLILFRFPPRNPIGGAYVRWMTRRAARKARRVLAVSETVRRDLIATLGCPPDKIVVTPNGIDPIFFERTTARPDSGYFLYAGNDKPHKNVATLVKAVAVVREKNPSLELVLCGAPFARFANFDGVRTAGFVSVAELAALYRGAVAVVVPSLDEGFGLPAAEAMACGAAVITSTAPALIEITGDAALHFEGHSADALAEAMLRIAADGALRSELGRRGAARAAAYTWRRCAELTRQAYLDVAGTAQA